MYFSIVIPTYQRRKLVVECVGQFEKMAGDVAFEVIVVVDGSTDDTSLALEQLNTTFPLRVVTQINQGRARAINHGVQHAVGSHLLFLDDDMQPHESLVREHLTSQQKGADLVLGHLPVHQDYAETMLGRAVESWSKSRLERLSASPMSVTLHDLITGQASVSRAAFDALGGFDEEFNQDGTFGNEDLDFCLRLQKAGYTVVFNPQAISWQKYSVTPRHHLRQWYQAGAADVKLAMKHRHIREDLFCAHRNPSYPERLCASLVRESILWLVDKNLPERVVSRLFFYARSLEYARGVASAGGMPGTYPLRVLAYHSISDLQGCRILNEYAVPQALFEQQLDSLIGRGYHFITPDQFLLFLRDEIDLEQKSVLLTFDDCYSDLLTSALPVLKSKNISAIAFAVSGRLGKTNDWDAPIGAAQIPLLDATGLRKLAENSIEIGAHSRNHVFLSQLSNNNRLTHETLGCIEELVSSGLPRPRFYAYPHGDFNKNTQLALQVARLEAGFTVEKGDITANKNCFALPRIEVFRSDGIYGLHWKMLNAGHRFKSKSGIRAKTGGGPGVSVVVPAYNAADTLNQTLNSLRSQTYANWQAIVVDDGSTDNTLTIAKAWACMDSRVDVISKSNAGESSSRNVGMSAAKHEWLLFLDSDDWITPDCLAVLTNAVSRNEKLAGVVCGCIRVTPGGVLGKADVYTPGSLDRLFLQFAVDCPFAIHNCMIRRSLVAQVGSFDTQLQNCADWDFWQRIARTGARFVTVPDVLAVYRLRPGSVSSNADQVQRDGFIVLARGHGVDSRVADPDPRYLAGAPAAGLREARYRHSVWPACLLIGQQKDPSLLLKDFYDQPFPELSPIVVADTIYDCIPLALADTTQIWPSRWHVLESRIVAYLDKLESVSQRPGLCHNALQQLKYRILDDQQLEHSELFPDCQWTRIDIDKPLPTLCCSAEIKQVVVGAYLADALVGSVSIAPVKRQVNVDELKNCIVKQLSAKIVMQRLRLDLRGEDKLIACLSEFKTADNAVQLLSSLARSVPALIAWQFRRGKLYRPRQAVFLCRIAMQINLVRTFGSMIRAAPGYQWVVLRAAVKEAMQVVVHRSFSRSATDLTINIAGGRS